MGNIKKSVLACISLAYMLGFLTVVSKTKSMVLGFFAGMITLILLFPVFLIMYPWRE